MIFSDKQAPLVRFKFSSILSSSNSTSWIILVNCIIIKSNSMKFSAKIILSLAEFVKSLSSSNIILSKAGIILDFKTLAKLQIRSDLWGFLL